MDPRSQLDREQKAIEREYEDGLLTRDEYNRAMHESERDYAEAAREAAEQASRDELERWERW